MPYYLMPDIPFDFGPQYQLASNVDQVQFGDGYMSAQPAGINYQKRAYSLQFTMLTEGEYWVVEGFFREHAKVKPFFWTPPWTNEVMQWRCGDPSGRVPTSARFANLQVSVQQDYTPVGAVEPVPYLGPNVRPLLLNGVRF